MIRGLIEPIVDGAEGDLIETLPQGLLDDQSYRLHTSGVNHLIISPPGPYHRLVHVNQEGRRFINGDSPRSRPGRKVLQSRPTIGKHEEIPNLGVRVLIQPVSADESLQRQVLGEIGRRLAIVHARIADEKETTQRPSRPADFLSLTQEVHNGSRIRRTRLAWYEAIQQADLAPDLREPSNGSVGRFQVAIGHSVAQEITQSHARTPTRQTHHTTPCATASSALRTDAPAAPRKVLCPRSTNLMSSTWQRRTRPTTTAIPPPASRSSRG